VQPGPDSEHCDQHQVALYQGGNLLHRFHVGVTIDFFPWLFEFVKHDPEGEEISGHISTEQLVWGKKNTGATGPGPLDWCIGRVCSADKCSFISWCLANGHLFNAAGRPLFAPVTSFVSHAWKCCFLDLVDAIMRHAANQTDGGTTSGYFIDIFLVNQHLPPWRENPPLGPELVLTPPIERGRSTLLVLSPVEAPAALTRCWCLFEIDSTLALNAKLDIQIPSSDLVKFRDALSNGEFDFNSWVSNIDIANADAFDLDDKRMIMNQVATRRGGACALNRRQ
jgi:hypothetical protein